MLYKTFFALTVFLLSSVAESQIIETPHIAEVMQFVDEDTWLLVDLDNTLFEAKQALGHANWFYDEMDQKLQKGMSREEAIREAYLDWVIVQKACPVQPLEEDFIPSLISLQNRGVRVMGLTHRQPCVADSTVFQVDSLGLDFTKTSPSKDSFIVPAANPTLYLQGILFVSDYNKKGDVFLSFLSVIQKNPKKVVFLDDKRGNVEDLEEVLAKEGIEYIGVHYTAIEHAKPVYSRELAELQYKFLGKIMSNEEAALFINKDNN